MSLIYSAAVRVTLSLYYFLLALDTENREEEKRSSFKTRDTLSSNGSLLIEREPRESSRTYLSS